MVRFTKIRWKNFLSTGNVWNEVLLNDTPTTLIVGDNGSGKSTLLDALCFVLFGKPFRNVNKGQLLNSINQKQAIVEVEFDVGQHEHKVVRGMRPNTFEIWKDGVLLNQDAAVKDYQTILEDQILNFTYKSFTQIVILGSASFTPFMQLPSGSRREIIEDLLDIKIFSGMNRVLKERAGSLSAELINLEGEIEVQKQRAMLQKAYIDTLKQDRETKIAENQAAIDSTLADVAKYEAAVERLQKEVDAMIVLTAPHTAHRKEQQRLQNTIAALNGRRAHIKKHLSFYKDNSECPTCNQGIDDELRENTIQANQGTLQKMDMEHDAYRDELLKIESALDEIATINEKVSTLNTQIVTFNTKIQGGQQYVNKMNAANKELQKNSANINEEKAKLKVESQKIVDLLTRRSVLNEDRQYMNVASMLLKDTGIKTKIIRQYLPIINKLVNKYLQAMDLFVNFELDESFNETIRSRHRDEFTYASFSEGEKQRINLALLFAWRAVASDRNTTNTNLLLFDEILDGSLDASAVDYFLNLVKDIGKKHNIFVISHKQDLFADKFDRLIKVQKISGYSTLGVIDK